MRKKNYPNMTKNIYYLELELKISSYILILGSSHFLFYSFLNSRDGVFFFHSKIK